ncbi:hypothetical protein Gotur_024012, partial [Gossypium turneri]
MNSATVKDLKLAIKKKVIELEQSKMGHRHISWFIILRHVWANFCLAHHNEKLLDDDAALPRFWQTVESERLLKQILSADEVQFCVHGTYMRNLESILESGLKRMKRLHVHFSSGLLTDGEVISGMTRDVTVLIYLDVRKALQ